MTATMITRILGAVAVVLTAILVVVIMQPPRPAADSTTGPVITEAANPSTSSAAQPSVVTPGGTDPDGEGEPSDLPSSEVDDQGDDNSPYSQTDRARRQWEPVVTGFGKAFTQTRGKTKTEWRAALKPFATDTVRDQLATVDLRHLPAGTLTRVEPAEYGDDKVAVFLHYDSGLTLVAYLMRDAVPWRIYAYDRWED